jgi:hypothetical protein
MAEGGLGLPAEIDEDEARFHCNKNKNKIWIRACISGKK